MDVKNIKEPNEPRLSYLFPGHRWLADPGDVRDKLPPNSV
jgi:hypothetical protein